MWSRIKYDDMWLEHVRSYQENSFGLFSDEIVKNLNIKRRRKSSIKSLAIQYIHVISSQLIPHVWHFTMKMAFYFLMEMFSNGFLSACLFVHLYTTCSWLKFRVWLYPRM